MKSIPSIYYTVIDQLEQNERCRNDDQYLICKVWLTRHNHKFEINKNSIPTIDLKSIVDDFESFESIRRTRQKIQNDMGLYMPTTLIVARARRINQEVWRQNMSHSFTKNQAKAIMEIFLRAKGENKKSLQEIKRDVVGKYLTD
jgi:hypothetical protein